MSTPRINPGPLATRDDFLAAKERERLLRTELPQVREVAMAWRNALAGLLTALIGFSLIKGRSDITLLSRSWAVGVGILLLAALICGAAGALLLIRAANGRPKMMRTKDVLVRSAADHLEAIAATRALHRGIVATLTCTTLLVAAVALTWYGPNAKPPALQVTTPGSGPICGTVLRVDQGNLWLKTNTGEVLVLLAEAGRLQPVVRCSAN